MVLIECKDAAHPPLPTRPVAFTRDRLLELETAILGAASNLDAVAMGPLTGNRYEVAQRMGLFDEWRRRLCDFLDMPPGPALRRGRGRSFVV